MVKIAEKYSRLQDQIPNDVTLLVATKERSTKEIQQVIQAGASVVGENYTRPEAQKKYEQLDSTRDQVEWHLIGHLQKNDINTALTLFDVIQSVESYEKAGHIDKRVEKAGRDLVPVYIEVNSAREDSKYGIDPEFDTLYSLLNRCAQLNHICVKGLMTMGPYVENPEEIRPYFRRTKQLFDKARDLDLPNCDIETLSMGMTGTYQVAIEEGANMIRLGTAIFGPRS